MSAETQIFRVAFQGEPGAFSEAAALQLLGENVTTVPRPTFDAAFHAISEGAADLLLVPIENTLAGSVIRVYDLLLASDLAISAETVLHIEHQLIGCPGASLAGIRTISSHPVALAQCEHFFAAHPHVKRVAVEDTAGSVRETIACGDKSFAGIAGRRAAEHYHGVILAENIHDNPENFTRFVLLRPAQDAPLFAGSGSRLTKMSIAMRLAHRPGALLSALEAFARHDVNLLKIESRPIHGRPWEYQFFVDIEADNPARLDLSLHDVRKVTSDTRILGVYFSAHMESRESLTSK